MQGYVRILQKAAGKKKEKKGRGVGREKRGEEGKN